MIKKTVKWILGHFMPRYRSPWAAGLIDIKDEVSGNTLKLTWRPDSMMESQLFRYGLYGAWERHSLRIWAHVSASAHEILDIGANTGIYSLLARANSPMATILAVEPIPVNADVLQANIDASSARVIVERIAMSDTDGVAVMYMLKDQLNYMTSINDDRYALHPEIVGDAEVVPINVPIGTWKGLQKKYSLAGPDLIKIDVEGHEVSVVRSLQEYIAQRRPTILLEIIGSENAVAINKMFQGLDYVFISIDEIACRATVVDAMWDNDHQNFLICDRAVAAGLVAKGLVQGHAGAAA
jgi:FkbM family methyltransferase